MKLLIFNSDYLHKILIISHHNSFASNKKWQSHHVCKSIEDWEEWKLEEQRLSIVQFIINNNYLVKKFILVQDILYPSPEWTPPNVALAEVLVAGCLRDESLHLLRHLEALLNAIILYKPDHYKDSLTSELNSFPVSLSLCTLTSVLKSLPVSLSLTRCTISNASLLRTSGSTDSPKEVKVSSHSI